MIKRTYLKVSDEMIAQMEAALVQVDGNFTLASRLIGMTPIKFRNTINTRPALKARWGNKGMGRPKGRAVLKKFNYDFEAARLKRFSESYGAQFCIQVLDGLPLDSQQDVYRWLSDRLSPRTETPTSLPQQTTSPRADSHAITTDRKP